MALMLQCLNSLRPVSLRQLDPQKPVLFSFIDGLAALFPH
jgi:hypothetical protein